MPVNARLNVFTLLRENVEIRSRVYAETRERTYDELRVRVYAVSIRVRRVLVAVPADNQVPGIIGAPCAEERNW